MIQYSIDYGNMIWSGFKFLHGCQDDWICRNRNGRKNIAVLFEDMIPHQRLFGARNNEVEFYPIGKIIGKINDDVRNLFVSLS